MPIERIDDLPPVITYPRDAVLEREHIATALHIGLAAVDSLDLPAFSIGARQRFIWGQVLDVLAERALPTARDAERAAAKRFIRKSA